MYCDIGLHVEAYTIVCCTVTTTCLFVTVSSMVQRSSAADRSSFSNAQRSQSSQDSDQHRARSSEIGRQESVPVTLQNALLTRTPDSTSHYYPKAYRSVLNQPKIDPMFLFVSIIGLMFNWTTLSPLIVFLFFLYMLHSNTKINLYVSTHYDSC